MFYTITKLKSYLQVHTLMPTIFQQHFPPMTVNFDLLTLTFERDLDNVKMNRRAKYLDQRSIFQNLLSGHTHTGPIALPGPLKWSVIIIRK